MNNVLQTLPQKLISILRNRKVSILADSNSEKPKTEFSHKENKTCFQTNVTYYKNDGSKDTGQIFVEYMNDEIKIIRDSLPIEIGAL